MSQLFSNNIDRTLGASLTDAATTLTISNGTGLSTPTGGDFELLTIQDEAGNTEIVKMTARATNTCTVVRAQEGTAARAWASGDRVFAAVTAATMDEMLVNEATGTNGFAVGINVTAAPNWACGFGRNVQSSGIDATAIGNGTKALGDYSMAVGNAAQAYNASSISLGVGAESYEHGGFSGPGTHGNIIIGEYTITSADGTVLIGHDAFANRQYSVAIGHEVASRPRYGVVIGAYAQTYSPGSPSSENEPLSESMVAIGYQATINAGSFGAVAVGGVSSVGTDAPGAVAVGYECQIANSAELGIGIGSVKVETERTCHIGALPAVPRNWDTYTTADAAWAMCAPSAVIMSDVVDLKAVADVTAPIWTGLNFFPEEVGLIITAATGVTGQPTIRFGTTGTLDKYLAATATTGLDTAHKRERFGTLASADGATSLTAGVTVAATGTTLTGRFYWRGFAVRDSA